jgi:hypothetical protein
MVEFAHIGVPVATHEIFPAAMVGVDKPNTHRRPAAAATREEAMQQMAYDDVV